MLKWTVSSSKRNNKSDVENGNSCESGNEEVLSLAEESAIEECLKDSEASLSTVDLELFNDFPDEAPKQNTRHKKSLAKRLAERCNFKYLTDIETNSDDDDSNFCPAKRKPNYFTTLRGKSSDNVEHIIAKGAADVTKSEEAEANSVVDVNLAKVMDEVEEMELLIYKKDMFLSSKHNYFRWELANNVIPVNLSTNIKNNENNANDVTSVNDKRVNDVSISNIVTGNESANINTIDDIKNQSFCNILEDSRRKWMEPSTSSYVTTSKMRVVRRKVKRKAKQLDNTHIYSFFSSMADQVSTLPYDSTLTVKSKVTALLEEMMTKLKEWNQDTSPQKLMQGHELTEKDLKLIETKLSMLPFVY